MYIIMEEEYNDYTKPNSSKENLLFIYNAPFVESTSVILGS